MRTIKQVNIYSKNWDFISEYWILTDKPDGYIKTIRGQYHKTMGARHGRKTASIPGVG